MNRIRKESPLLQRAGSGCVLAIRHPIARLSPWGSRDPVAPQLRALQNARRGGDAGRASVAADAHAIRDYARADVPTPVWRILERECRLRTPGEYITTVQSSKPMCLARRRGRGREVRYDLILATASPLAMEW